MDIFVKEKEKRDYFMPKQGGTINVYLAKNSQLRFYTFTFGGNSVKNNLNIVFQGANAKAELYGLYLTDDGKIIENNTFLWHLAPFGQSFQQYFGILLGKGKALFQGRIRVERKAKKTDAYLENKNILLSKDAQLLAQPFLEIFTDDVRCTHAFASFQLSEDEILYLRSRGIDKKKAKKILLFVFAQKIINKVASPLIKEKLWPEISQFLDKKSEEKN